jgi:NAD(P)-dependent dehydrogenase (short-subunit alcohol dehydrogenase family)
MPLPNGEPTAAEVVALANRFMALKASPGFHDLKALCDMLHEEARGAVSDYDSDDRDELFRLNMRTQVAKRLIAEIFGRIDAAINNASGLPGFVKEDPRPQPLNERIAGSY